MITSPASDASATKVYEYAWHEGNYGMLGILGGARRLEQSKANGGSQ